MPDLLRASFLLPLALAACSEEQARGAPDVTLPRIGLVGAPPPAETTLVVTVTREGRIWCGSEEVDADGFRRRMEIHAHESGARLGPGLYKSDRTVLFRLDASLAHGRLTPLLLPLTRQDAWIHRVYYAAESESPPHAAALPLFLPSPRSGGLEQPAEVWTIESSGPEVDDYRSALFHGIVEHLRNRDSHYAVEFELAPTEDVPVGTVLRQAETCLRAGAAAVWLNRPMSGGHANETRVRCFGSPVEIDPRPMPPIQHGR